MSAYIAGSEAGPRAEGGARAGRLKGEPERAAPARARHAQITQITQFYTDYADNAKKLELRRITQKSHFLRNRTNSGEGYVPPLQSTA